MESGMFRRLYDVINEEPFLSEPYDLVGRINLLIITSEGHERMATYLFKRKDTTILGVADLNLNQDSTVFEYPPRTFTSVLFYMLNPEVEKYIRHLARDYLHSNEVIEMLNTWESVYDRVMMTKVEKDILNSKKLEYGNALDSAFIVSDSPRYKVLSLIGICPLGEGESLQRFYKVVLKKVKINSEYFKIDNIDPEYLMIHELDMVYFMKKMLPRTDIITLFEDTSSLLQLVRKVPVLIKLIESLDDEWFTKPTKGYKTL
ncbi:MAG: hypothetical protein QXK54_04510 [Ignisphaera sp.]